MNVVAYGGGTDSTAMLIECYKRSIKIDLVMFADTGGEKPHTYEYIKMFNKWLLDHNMPEITIVRSHLPDLYTDCMNNKFLPSVAYGFKSCSDKWKIRPVDKYLRANFFGEETIKFIGIDASESRRAIPSPRKWCSNYFPLVEWDIDRDECLEIIAAEGLPLPGKSACYFCPSSKAHEVKALKRDYPELADKCIAMEKNAELTKIKGLGRNWAWGDLLATEDMFDEEPVQPIEIACGCYDG